MDKLFALTHNELMKLALKELPRYIYFENFSKDDTVFNGYVDEPIGYDGQEFECTACGFKWADKGRAVKHKECYTCPECENTEIAYNRKIGRRSKKLHLNLVVFRKEDYNNVWAECIRVDAEDFTDIYEPRIINFQRRALYHFQPGKAEKYKGSYDGSYRLMKSCNDYKFYVSQGSSYCHEEEFDALIGIDIVENSFLKYFELYKWEDIYTLMYTALCCTAPLFAEFFTKIDLREIIKAKIEGLSGATENINIKAKSVPELFPKLSKSAVKRLVKYLTQQKPDTENFRGTLSYLSVNKPESFDKIEELWGGLAGRAAAVLAITKDSPVTLYNYLCKQSGNGTLGAMLSLYSDYARECKSLGYNFTSIVMHPKNLREKHTETSKLCRYTTSESEIKKSAERAKKLEKQGYSYTYKNLTAVIPANTIEIIKEGAAQNHCVGSYCGSHADGKTTIIFVRKTVQKDTPYFTLQIDKNFKINQCYGKGNKVSYKNNPEVNQFLEHYVKHLKYCREKGVKTA